MSAEFEIREAQPEDVPAIFEMIREAGSVPEQDMMRTFNMGIGMVAIVADGVSLDGATRIGSVRSA